jgi:DNA-binding NarL/FixJ family response regulator
MQAAAERTILVAEELALLRDGISALCESIQGGRIVATAEDGQQALRLITELQPQIALLDLYLPSLDTLELVRTIDRQALNTRSIIFSERRDRKTVLESLRAGASGYLLLSTGKRHLTECLEQVSRGVVYLPAELDPQSLFAPGARSTDSDPLSPLSAREVQVFNLLVSGVRAKEIAARLSLSPKTVDTYRSSLMRKLDIYDVAGLVRFAIQHALLPSWKRPRATGAVSGL